MELFIILSIVGVFKTIIIIAVIYFAIKLFTRLILPNILENKLKDVQQKMQEQQKQQERSGKREGEVTIEYGRKKNNTQDSNQGEYIDFEEIE